MKRKTSKHGLYVVKLDMQAYDRVEWCFLRGIMLEKYLISDELQLVMACVTLFDIRLLQFLSNGLVHPLSWAPTRGSFEPIFISIG